MSPLQAPNIHEARRKYLREIYRFDFMVVNSDAIQTGCIPRLRIVIQVFTLSTPQSPISRTGRRTAKQSHSSVQQLASCGKSIQFLPTEAIRLSFRMKAEIMVTRLGRRTGFRLLSAGYRYLDKLDSISPTLPDQVTHEQ